MDGSSVFELGVVLSLRDLASNKIDEINNKWDSMRKKLGETNVDVVKMDGAIADMKTGGAFIGAGLAVGYFTKSLIDARMKTSELEGNLKSLGLSTEEVDKITNSVYSMSSTTGVASDRILTGIYDIKSAVSDLNGTELVGFTQSVLDATIATKGNFEEMSKLFGMAYHQFKHLYADMDNVQFGKNLANDIAWASNVYRADGQTIQQAMESIGSKAASLKISLEEQSAVLGTLLNSMQPGTAGTSYRAFLTNVGEGFTKLGLNAYQSNGKLKDTADLLGEVRKKYGDSLDLKESDVLKKAFGTDEAVQFINALLPKTDTLKKDITQIVELSRNGDYSFLDIAKKANLEAMSTQVKRVGEGWENFQKILGKGVENSGLRTMFGVLADGIQIVNDFLKERPKLAEFAGTFLMISTAALLGVGGFLLLKGAYTAFMVAVNIGLISNPFGWVILGVVGAIAGLALLITYWSEIKGIGVSALSSISEKWNQFKGLLGSGWEKIKAGWSGIPDWAKGLVAVVLGLIFMPLAPIAALAAIVYHYWDDIYLTATSVYEKIIALWTGFVNVLSVIWSGITMVWNSIWNGILSIGPTILAKFASFWKAIPDSAKTAGLGLLSAFGEGILSGANLVLDPLKNVLSMIGRFLPHSNAEEGPLSNLTGSGSAFVDTFALGMKQRKNYLSTTMNDVASAFDQKLDSAKNYGIKFVDTVKDGVLSSVNTMKKGMESFWTKGIVPTVNQSDAKEGPLSKTSNFGKSFVSTYASGIESETSRISPIMSRFNSAITPDSKGILRRAAEDSESEDLLPGRQKPTYNVNIGSLIGQLLTEGRENKGRIGEILTDALFSELDRFEEAVV
ncbi:phage tail tape measure protein [Leptospira weilii]|uniref:phage tail tape measure protein n=1 Tax=Leptospira weilii TaxID=28184 RepID=UPI00037FD451|nr:phage tail tape measure protein [Leptospira weilii]